MGNKEYLGDGAYVDFDGYALILTAEDGQRATDTVVLEPVVWRALMNYVSRLERAKTELHPPQEVCDG